MNILFFVYLSLVSKMSTTAPQPIEVRAEFTDPATPSCNVFAARMRQFQNDLHENSLILERLAKKRGRWTASDQLELNEALRRQSRLQRELKAQKLKIAARFAIVPEATWVAAKKFRLSVRSPGLDWVGFDSYAPEGFLISAVGGELQVQHEIHLADYCSKPSEMQVQLEEVP